MKKISIFHTAQFTVIVLLLFAAPLFYADPAIFGTALPDAFNFPKRYLVEIACLVIFILHAARAMCSRCLAIPRSKSLLPFVLFIAWGAFSLLYAPGFHAGVRPLIRWICYGLLFYTALEFRGEPRRINAAVLFVVGSALLVSLAALAQAAGADIFSFRGGLHRIYSTLGNPNYCASYLAVALPLGYGGWLFRRSRPAAAALCLAFSLIGTAALLLSGSRGGLLALPLGTAAAACFARPTAGRLRLIVLAVLIAVIAAALFVPSPLSRRSPDTLGKFSQLAEHRGSSLEWRVMVWRICLRMMRQRPLIGWGAGSFRLLYLDNLARFLALPGNGAYAAVAEWGIDYAHDDYLQAAVELGLAGLALFAWLLVSMARGLVGEARRPAGGAAWAVLAGFFAMLVHALVSFPFHIWPTAVTLFILAGMLTAPRAEFRRIPLERPWALPAVLAALLCIAAFSAVSIGRTVVSEALLARGMAAFRAKRPAGALPSFRAAVRWQPHNGRAHFFLALSLSAQKDYRGAIRELTAARETYGRQQIYVEFARNYDALGRRGDALAAIERAVAMLPRDQGAWLLKGNILFRGGDLDGAVSCYEKSLALKPDSFDAARNLAVALDARGDGEKALEAYRAALELRPDAAGLYVNMGALEARRGNMEKARALWEKAFTIDPGNVNAAENLKRLEGQH